MIRRLLTVSLCLSINGFAADGMDDSVNDSTGAEYRKIPAGHFPMGSGKNPHSDTYEDLQLAAGGQFYGNDERPRHHTFITKPFYMAETEVTVGQFRKFIEETGYVPTAQRTGPKMLGWSPYDRESWDGEAGREFARGENFSWKDPGFPQGDNHPVVGVSWDDANAYAEWLSKKEGKTYRLPTEAEWEYASRGSTRNQHFSFGNEITGKIHKHANIANVELAKERPDMVLYQWIVDADKDPGDGAVFTAPVGSYEPNAYGLHDMHGNVWEWTRDFWVENWYDQYEKQDDSGNQYAVDPLNDSTRQTEGVDLRVARGGSWAAGVLSARSAMRGFFDAPDSAAYLGFRLLREAPAEVQQAAGTKIHDEVVAAKERLAATKSEIKSNHTGEDLWLDARGEDHSPEFLQDVAAIPGLDTIRRLQTETWTQEHIDALASIPNLQALDIHVGDFSGDLSPIAVLPSLRILVFQNRARLGPEQVGQLGGTTTLRELRFHANGPEVTDEVVAGLGGNQELETLSIEDAALTGEFLKSFEGAPLKSLSIRPGNSEEAIRVTNAGLALVSKFPAIQQLDVRSGNYDDKGLRHLASLTNLRELDLSGAANLTDEALADTLAKFYNLERLDLDGTPVGPATAEVLSQLHFLEELSLDHPSVDDAIVAKIGYNSCLRELSLGADCTLTPASLQNLRYATNLRELKVENATVTGPEVASLSVNENLRNLHLPAEALSNPDAYTALLELKQLDTLHLHGDRELEDQFEARLKTDWPELKIR